ncbi:diaminopimelate epimerase [Abditibacterium utsteinense]|uniref:Diaminopimelate epimerase n=1 Tax=Abditibacterium utsteinense TaxID=1960156 RepID=A0A2S8STR1_9BACT|nr:diaminopimelate epimerase [Abditibacterium utsteinense]PQV64192.1 diaminopimelate epimerase [Abditibacterium utsteinense]
MNSSPSSEIVSTKITFTKMHGLGNDFVMLDCIKFPAPPDHILAQLSEKVCDRHFGVGADGLILILEDDEADYRMRMFNPDGSEGVCGNGIRCFGKYLFDAGLIEAKAISVAVEEGVQLIEILPGQNRGANPLQVRVDMGAPRLLRSQIPMTIHEGNGGDGRVINEPLNVNGEIFRITAVSMGNPHVVIFVDDVESVPLKEIGLEIEHHEAFPARTNVHFVQEMGRAKFWVRHWERGAGDTLACGTGACASIVAAALNRKLPEDNRRALAHLPGGDLIIEWAQNDKVFMTGPAMTVLTGTLDSDFLKGLS